MKPIQRQARSYDYEAPDGARFWISASEVEGPSGGLYLLWEISRWDAEHGYTIDESLGQHYRLKDARAALREEIERNHQTTTRKEPTRPHPAA